MVFQGPSWKREEDPMRAAPGVDDDSEDENDDDDDDDEAEEDER